MHQIDYTVNDEDQHTREQELAPKTIMGNAGFDPASHYLVLLRGHDRISYKEHPDDPIKLHEHMKFLAISCAPTPVS